MAGDPIAGEEQTPTLPLRQEGTVIRRASSDALARALNPSHIAVFGASATPGKRGYRTAKILIENGFSGRLTLVNPRGGSVFERPLVDASHAKDADVAIIATPAATVPGIIRQCGEVGIALAVVTSAGFAEAGQLDLHNDLLRRVVETGVRVVGPNCPGIAATPASLYGFGGMYIPVGRVSVLTQSGGVGQDAARRLAQLGAGIDVMLGLGNKIDVDFTDALPIVGARETTSAILLYLESLDEGDALLEMIEHVSREVPIVAVLPGRTVAGKSATASHTGSMVGNWDRAAGLLTDAGAVVFASPQIAAAAAAGTKRRRRLPKLTSVFAICDGGGLAALLADGIEGAGYELPTPSVELATRLRAITGPDATVSNPVELAASVQTDPSIYSRLLETVLLANEHDAVVLGGALGGTYGSSFNRGDAEAETVGAIARLVRTSSTPIVLQTTRATEDNPIMTVFRSGGVTPVEWPDEVAAVLQTYGRPAPAHDSAPTDEKHASMGLARATEEVLGALDRSGIPHALGRRVERDDVLSVEPGRWVLRLDGFPHKTRDGAIAIGVLSEELGQSYDRLAAVAAEAGIQPIVRLAPFIPHDHELIVTIWRGREGCGIVAGAGGTNVEHHRDVAIARIPKTRGDVHHLLARSAAGRQALLSSNELVEELVEVVLAVIDVFTRELHALTELELNPIAMSANGPVVLDVLPTSAPYREPRLLHLKGATRGLR